MSEGQFMHLCNSSAKSVPLFRVYSLSTASGTPLRFASLRRCRCTLSAHRHVPLPHIKGKALGAHNLWLLPLQGGEAPRSGDEGVSCAARHSSDVCRFAASDAASPRYTASPRDMFPAGTFRRILLPENLGSEPIIRLADADNLLRGCAFGAF